MEFGKIPELHQVNLSWKAEPMASQKNETTNQVEKLVETVLRRSGGSGRRINSLGLTIRQIQEEDRRRLGEEPTVYRYPIELPIAALILLIACLTYVLWKWKSETRTFTTLQACITGLEKRLQQHEEDVNGGENAAES